jgi:hypothetical protein
MKSLFARGGLCLLGLLVAVAAVPRPATAQSLPAAPALQRVSPQARQLLDRAIQALGGQAFLTAKTLSTKGRAFVFQDGETAGMEPFESWYVYPDKRRFSYGKTKPVILINNGTQGWELDQYGLIVQPDQQIQGWVRANHYSLENLLRLRVNEPDVLIQVGQPDFVDNVPVQSIEITAVGGTSVRLYLRRQTFLPIRISYRVRNVKEDAWDDYSDAYSDFLPIDGIQTPMHITRYLNDERIGETFRISAKYNDNYPANYFTAE